jgi:integrase/recombinase XerD
MDAYPARMRVTISPGAPHSRSALTRDAEDSTGTPMLMARSGHRSARSLTKYARVSAEALDRHQAGRCPACRR